MLSYIFYWLVCYDGSDIMVGFLLTIIVIILLAQFFPVVLNVLAWIFFACITLVIIGMLIAS